MSNATVTSRPTVAAIVDLRTYAAGTAPSNDWIGGRAIPAFADAAASVAALAPRGQGRVEPLAADEFVIVLSGRIDIRNHAGNLVLGTGESGVLPCGTGFDWTAVDDTLAIIASVPATQPGDARDPVFIDEGADLVPSNPPLADLLVGPAPSCRNHSDYWSANREFVCGTWDSTPYHRRQMPYRHIELMHLLDGSVSFADDAGRVTFSKGDVFLAMRGDGCAWISEVDVKKVYATQRPAA